MADSNTPCDVLMIDTDPARCFRFTALLQDEGFCVEGVLDAASALERLASTPRPRFIVLDLSTCASQDWEFLHRQMRDPASRAIPIVALWDPPDAGMPAGLEVAASVSRRDEFEAVASITVLVSLQAFSRRVAANDNARCGRPQAATLPGWFAAGAGGGP